MNFKKLLPISLISLGMLIGCGGDQGGGSTFPQDHEDGVHTIELNQEKLAELKAIWYDDGNARNVQDAIVSIKENGQEQNIAKAVASKKLTLAVEKEDVLAVAGMTITPKAIDAQTKACKVAVKYYDTVKSFEVTITHRKTPKEYGAKHDGTAADPMDNEDLITVAKAQKAEGGFAPVEYYAKGEVDSFYKSQLPDSGQNVVSFYYKPAAGQTDKFEVYKATYDGKPANFKWTSQDIWVGATVTAKGKFKEYNGQFEFDPSTVTKVEGEPPAPPATIEVNVAKALQAGANLANNESTYDYYQITGLVKAIVTPFDPTSQYKQITVTMVDALTDETGVDTYRLACTAEQAAQFLYGSTLVAKGKLMKYNDKIQLAQGCEIISISGGEEWPNHDEPTLVTGKTVAEFLADTAGNGKQLYEIKGVITRWADNATDASAYGNFFIKDETDTSETPAEIYVYGATATATALTWDRTAGIYTFKNPQDFLTNDMTKLAAIGGKITIKLTRCDYKETKEGQGIVTDVEGHDPVDPPVPPVGEDFVVDFSAKTAKHNSYKDTWQYGDVTIAGGANNNGQWAFVKFGPKAETLALADYPGTYMKTDKALEDAIATVSMKFVGKCYNQDDEKASVKIEAYSDANLTTKVGETESKEVPAISTYEGTETLNFSFATPTANLYYKVVFEIINTTTYNGVVALEKVTFSAGA